MKKIIFILMGLVFLSLVFISAESCPVAPSIPVSYSGNILYDGEIIEEDYDIIAYIGNYGSRGSVEDGNYYIDISCYNSASATISFFINGVEANEHPEFNGEEDFGKEITLNLTFDEIPPAESSCGDGVKDSGEVCDGNDFGALTCSNYGFNAGSLSCSASCVNINIDNCYTQSTSSPSAPSSGGSSGGGSSGGSSSGSTPKKITQTANNDGTINLNLEEEKPKEEESSKTSSGITGAAILNFAKSSGGIATSVFLLLGLIGAFVALKIKKKMTVKKTEENSEEKAEDTKP